MVKLSSLEVEEERGEGFLLISKQKKSSKYAAVTVATAIVIAITESPVVQ